MKITNAELTTNFIQALRELSSLRTNTKVAYNTVKTIKSTDVAIGNYDAARKNILETRCEKEGDKPKIDKETNEYVFASDEVKKEAIDSINELALTEIELEVFPVKIEDFGNTEISALTLLGLKDFVTEK